MSTEIPERLWPRKVLVPTIDPRRALEVKRAEELRVADETSLCSLHLKLYCHDSSKCPICLADKAGYERGYRAAIKMVAEG